jgi:hypothetical protein
VVFRFWFGRSGFRAIFLTQSGDECISWLTFASTLWPISWGSELLESRSSSCPSCILEAGRSRRFLTINWISSLIMSYIMSCIRTSALRLFCCSIPGTCPVVNIIFRLLLIKPGITLTSSLSSL